MGPTEHIIIKEHSRPEVVDRAFNTMRETFTTLVTDYCRTEGLSLDEAIIRAGCPHPKIAKQFLLEGAPVPTGIDLERLLSFAGAVQTFAERVPITIGSEIEYPQAACGTAVDEDGNFRHVSGDQVPESLDRLVKRVFSITTWFYIEAAKRFLAEDRKTSLNDARLPPAP